MFSSTLKRSAAAVAVAAGLLAAAGPASATWSNGDGNDIKPWQTTHQGVLITNGTADDQMTVASPRAAAYVLPWLWDNQTNVTFNPGIGDDIA